MNEAACLVFYRGFSVELAITPDAVAVVWLCFSDQFSTNILWHSLFVCMRTELAPAESAWLSRFPNPAMLRRRAADA
jgi:hypothetical protein